MWSRTVVGCGAIAALIFAVAGAWTLGCGSSMVGSADGGDRGTIVKFGIFGVPVSWDTDLCGASLVGTRWILTAAHCFEKTADPDVWEATLGETNAKAWRPFCTLLGTLFGVDNWRVYKVPVVKIIMHPEYQKEFAWHNDIALLKLKYAVPATIAYIPRIRKVALPIQGDSSFPKPHQECYMKGWGCDRNGGPQLDFAQESMLPVYSTAECRNLLVYEVVHEWSTRLCAGLSDTSRGICPGDSGGPLVCRRNNKWVQYGIASFSTAANPAQVPGVFIRVSAYVDWIKLMMSDN